MQRKGRFHFAGEHIFWNPSSTIELAWYYATSIDYLFANALHTTGGSRLSDLNEALSSVGGPARPRGPPTSMGKLRCSLLT